MFDRNKKNAFTLVETMVASSIAVVVLGATVSTMLFCHTMFRQIMVEAESSLALREIRDKLLFHAGIKDGNRLDDGLLTGKWKADSASLMMSWIDSNDGPENIRIILRSDAKGNYFFNERCPHNESNDKWFRPGLFRLADDWSAILEPPFIKINLLDPIIGGTINSTYICLPEELNMEKGR